MFEQMFEQFDCTPPSGAVNGSGVSSRAAIRKAAEHQDGDV
jgi:hypothetical protein